MSTDRPTVAYVALGGTIAAVPGSGPGVRPTLGASDLAAGVPGLEEVARLDVHTFRTLPSFELTMRDVLELVPVLHEAVEAGAAGVVVSQGTDTIEETAFVLDLLWERPETVVVTGAKRNPSLPGADGPANLLASVQLAASAEARECGVLVCLGDEVHAARHVHKARTSSPAAFHSPGLGPIGWVAEGRPVVALRPTRRAHLDVDPSALVPVVVDLLQRGPVVLASRAGAGEVLATTYGSPGAEMDLLERGVIRAGALDALKSRLLLALALAAGLGRAGTVDLFGVVGTTTGPVACD
jgi:L-asparaginase